MAKICTYYVAWMSTNIHLSEIVSQIVSTLLILLLAFKVIHGQAPAYLSSLASVKSKSYYSLRSNSSTLFDPPKGKMLVTLGGRSFQAAVPQLWNALPQNLRNITSVETFKKNFKTFIFRKAFARTYYNYYTLLIISILILVIRSTILIFFLCFLSCKALLIFYCKKRYRNIKYYYYLLL